MVFWKGLGTRRSGEENGGLSLGLKLLNDAAHFFSSMPDGYDRLKVAHVSGRVGVEDDEIGELTSSDGAAIVESQRRRRVNGSGLQGFEGRQPGFA